jgi:hypothetical protein
MLAACGGVPEAELAPADGESLGTGESAMCSLMSVTNLAVDGMTSYNHELAGSGTWKVSPYTNSVYMEYWFDNEPYPTTQKRMGTYDQATGTTSGTWSYSKANVSCGSHTVVIKAFPRHYGSDGSEEICSNPMTITRTVVQDCGTPQLNSLYCSRYPDPYTASTVRCDTYASGGSGSYTYWWRTNYGGWVQGGTSQFFSCRYSGYSVQTQYQVKVVDSAGKESPILTSSTFFCG